MTDCITIVFIGAVPAKKNKYRPRFGGSGKRFFKDTNLDAALKALDAQIPANYRGLKLEHPEIEWYFQVPAGKTDRDNKITTILDILVAAGVLYDDNIRRCNGKWTVNEAEIVKDQEETTIVVIKPAPPQQKDKARRMNDEEEVASNPLMESQLLLGYE
jgi:Holliday junction resolvase RusA-like endonuclease